MIQFFLLILFQNRSLPQTASAAKDITPADDEDTGTGLRSQLDAIALDGIADPPDESPDPDTILEEHYVDPQPQSQALL